MDNDLEDNDLAGINYREEKADPENVYTGH